VTAATDLQLLGRVTISLVVVVLIALVVARLARRAGMRGPGVGLRVVDRVGLTREASLAVVEVGGSALVLGVTAHSVSVLSMLDAATLAEALPPEPAAPRRLGSRPAGSTGSAGSTASAAKTLRGTGSVLDPRTWQQGLEALRDLTARR
jgi:flagellar biogenesis protein FliO